jgi:hypothetical protein
LCRFGLGFGRCLLIFVVLGTGFRTRCFPIVVRIDAGLHRVIICIIRDYFDYFDLFANRTVLVVHIAVFISPLVDPARQRRAANPEGCGDDYYEHFANHWNIFTQAWRMTLLKHARRDNCVITVTADFAY